MLILTRRVGESVHIGEQVMVKVLSVRGSQVRLGIDAPREIKVNRDEVVNPRPKQSVKRAAANAQTSDSAPGTAESERKLGEAAQEPVDAERAPSACDEESQQSVEHNDGENSR